MFYRTCSPMKTRKGTRYVEIYWYLDGGDRPYEVEVQDGKAWTCIRAMTREELSYFYNNL